MSTPSTTRAAFRSYLTPLIEGRAPITATTSAAGAVDKTTMVASTLIEYCDDFGQGGFFNGWWAYQAAASEERRVKEFVPETGTLSFHRAFTSVAQSLAFELHPYPVADYNEVINRTLKAMYTEGYYSNPAYNETLWGQNAYGEDPNEFNKYEYTVPTSFQEFPKAIWLREAYTGEHTGSDAAAALTDSSKGWTTDELVGMTIFNKTDGSSGTITANTDDDVTATLSGGTDNDWDEGDEYIVAKPNRKPYRLTNYRRTGYGKGGAFKFWASIPEDRLIILEGPGPLTAYTTDAGTTELYEDQARIAAMWAAYEFCDMMSQRYGEDRSEWSQRALEWRQKFVSQIHGGMEKPSGVPINRSWL